MNWSYLLGALSALAILAGATAWWLRRRAPTGTDAAIRSVAAASLYDVVIPNGMGGQIYIEHLLLTNRGLVVVDVKDFAGVVFASDQMQEWTVIGKGRRFGFPNPQGTLLDRVAAVRQVVHGVPIEGHIVFSAAADFSKGRPKHVLLASELEKRFKKPTKDERERLNEAFSPHWSRIKAVAERAGAMPGR